MIFILLKKGKQKAHNRLISITRLVTPMRLAAGFGLPSRPT